MNKPKIYFSHSILVSYLKFIFLLIIIISFAGLSLSCKGDEQSSPSPTASKSPSQTQEDNLTNLDPASAFEEIVTNYNTAKQKVLQWQSNAVLYSASAKIPQTLDPKDVIEIYTFGSPNSPHNWWSFSISVRSKNYIRAIIPKEDYLGHNLSPLNTKYWKINYIEAFQIAENNGGKEWRAKQTQIYQIVCTLAHGIPNNYLYWIVDYSTLSSSDKKSVQINAYNGDVVEQENPSSSPAEI